MSATVLIVDDSPEHRIFLRRTLTRNGFETLEAETGAEGLQRALDALPDLVILDVNLPDLDGFEVARRLRADPRTAGALVLQVSAASIDPRSRVEGLDSGADAYLTAPIDAAVLTATVRALLRLRTAEHRLRSQVEGAETLRRLTAAFAEALTTEQVADAVGTEFPGTATMVVFDETGALPDGAPASAAAVAESSAGWFDRAGAAVPLIAYGRRLGVLELGFAHPHEPDEDERSLLLALGELCGQALERAQLFEDQIEIATTLQQSLLPTAWPVLPGVRIGMRYASGTRNMEVGGDFYDVVERDGDWLAVIGDVCGRGARAAALTSLARHTIRAHAEHLSRPSDILLALDRAVRAALEPGDFSFLTAVVARMRPERDRIAVTLAVGGHPPPVIVRAATGAAEPVVCKGALIGALPDITIGDCETTLEPGDALVLYTDGVTEAPTGGKDRFGEDRLVALLGELGGRSAQAMADAIVDATHVATGNDDIAVLVIELAAGRPGTSGAAELAAGRPGASGAADQAAAGRP